MLLRTNEGFTVKITRLYLGDSVKDCYFAEGYYEDSGMDLTEEELYSLTDQYYDRLAEEWSIKKGLGYESER